MDDVLHTVTPIKSALFVDFDNIYIGLGKTDPQAAERFASDPSRWLAWLEKGCLSRGSTQERPRSILIRRCYPNPDAGFRRYRSFFTSAAFSVIDCPSLTRTGKNSADIYMVMDVLDTLNHKTYFDEFIIFSGDSDFMPVLLRLRAHDRRTTTLGIDFMPPAYKAACDFVISEEEFIEEALGLSVEGNCAGGIGARARVPVAVLKAMAARVYAAVDEAGEVQGADLPDILKDFHEFRDSNNWLGFGTSQRLAEALVCSESRLQLARVNALMYKLVLKPALYAPEPPPAGVTPAASPPTSVAPVPVLVEKTGLPVKRPFQRGRVVENSEKTDLPSLRSQVVSLVRELVQGSETPVLLARASQYVVSKLGHQVLSTQWAGAGTFKKLLQTVKGLGLEITTHPEPGYLFDPRRHENPSLRGHGEYHGAAETIEYVDHALPEEGGLAAENTGMPSEALAAESQHAGEGTADSIRSDGALSNSALLDNASSTGRYEPASRSYADDDESDEDEEDEAGDEDYEESLPSLEEFVRRVGQVTGAPELEPHQYALVFHGVIAELQQIAAEEKGYNTYQSSRAISDWCAERGVQISRGDVALILKGIIFQDGVRFSKHPGSYTAMELARIVRRNIQALCRRSRMVISEYEERLLDEWILGGLEEEENEAAYHPEAERAPLHGVPLTGEEQKPPAANGSDPGSPPQGSPAE